MARDLISKSVLNVSNNNSGNTSALRPTTLRTKTQVRTNVLVNSIFYNLLEGYSERQTDILSLSTAELEVIETFKKLLIDFKLNFNDTVVELCIQLNVTSGNVKGVIWGVLNELFSGGITWAHIVTLFVFTSELAAQCVKRELSKDMVENVKNCCLEFVEDNMEKWVQDHGGWEGIIDFAQSNRLNSGNQQVAEGATSPGWAKSVLHGTVRMIGTLAQIANYTEPMLEGIPTHKVKM